MKYHLPNVEGKVCNSCYNRYRDSLPDRQMRRKERIEELVAANKCNIHRDQPSLKGLRWCQRCKDLRLAINAKNKAEGICMHRCGAKAKPGKTLCQRCIWILAEKNLGIKFGITLEEYAWMEHDQNKVCAICKRKEKTGRSLAVDHNHQTGKVRGLLCFKCNWILGYMENHNIVELFKSYSQERGI